MYVSIKKSQIDGCSVFLIECWEGEGEGEGKGEREREKKDNQDNNNNQDIRYLVQKSKKRVNLAFLILESKS